MIILFIQVRRRAIVERLLSFEDMGLTLDTNAAAPVVVVVSPCNK